MAASGHLRADHDIIDGAPAARFVQRFKQLLESGFGLCEQDLPAALDAISLANS
jgi:hypothetical protein